MIGARLRVVSRATNPGSRRASRSIGVAIALTIGACGVEDESVRRVASPITSSPIEPTADETLVELSPNNNNGASPMIFAGRDAMVTMNRRRALVSFDVSSIPPASRATIDRVRLTMRLRNVPLGSVDSNIELVAITESWVPGAGNMASSGQPCANVGVGGVTWATRDCTTAWMTAGGSIAVSASGSVLGAGAVGSDLTWDSDVSGNAAMVTDVVAWRAGGSNFGWLLRSAAETTASTVRGFDSVNSIAAGTAHPQLVVDYTCLVGFAGTNCDPIPDAGQDAGQDAGDIDAGQDAGDVDAGQDAGEDAGTAMGDDAGPFDAGQDSGTADVDAGEPPEESESGCGCVAAGARSSPVTSWLSIGLGLFGIAARRRARSKRLATA